MKFRYFHFTTLKEPKLFLYGLWIDWSGLNGFFNGLTLLVLPSFTEFSQKLTCIHLDFIQYW